MSLLASYQENRDIFYYNPNLRNLSAPGVPGPQVPEVAQFGWGVDYFDTFIPQTARPGVVDTVPAQDSATKGFYGIRQNPSNTGTIGLLGTEASSNKMAECDTQLMVGSGFTWAEFLPAEGTARGVQIDIKADMLSIRYPMECNLQGDAAETLRQLLPLIH